MRLYEPVFLRREVHFFDSVQFNTSSAPFGRVAAIRYLYGEEGGLPRLGRPFSSPGAATGAVPVKTVVVLVKTIVVLVRTGAALVRFSSRTGLRGALSAVCGAVSAIPLVLTEVKNVNVNRALRGSVQKGLGVRRGVRALLRCRPSCGNAAGCLEKNDYLCPENP